MLCDYFGFSAWLATHFYNPSTKRWRLEYQKPKVIVSYRTSSRLAWTIGDPHLYMKKEKFLKT